MLLDTKRHVDGSDFRLLADQLSEPMTSIIYLQEKIKAGESPTEILIVEHNLTLAQLHFIFKDKRQDIIDEIENFLKKECNCTNHNSIL